MNEKEIKELLTNAITALESVLNNSTLSIKKLSKIIRLKREINEVINLELQIISNDGTQQELNFEN